MVDESAMIRLLHLEDDDLDAELVAATLARANIQAELHRARNRAEFRQLLEQAPELILVDFQLPDLDGFEATDLAQTHCPEVPVIIVSGAIGEQLAIDSLHRGATDFVLKKGLARLAPAIHRALELNRERARRKEAEQARQHLEDELRQRVEDLNEMSRRKDEFLAMLAHELRNPLAPIRTSVDILRRLESNDNRFAKARDIIGRQVMHLSRLVDDLLDINRITRGKIELRMETVDLADVARLAVETVQPLITARGHKLNVELPAEPVRVEGDQTRLSQAIGNLLSNAAKYMHDQGYITLSVGLEPTGDPEAPRQAVVRVRDAGVGIPEEMLPRVFELFTQLSQARDLAGGGLGIGLTLVRALVEMHGGKVEAFSDGVDRGSEFVVVLPCSKTMPRDALAARNQDGRAVSRRVLIVDDVRDNRDTMAMLLLANGHIVETARDGPAALALAESFRPTVILLDVGLPGMNGYEVCRRIRQDLKLNSVLIAAMTGFARPQDHRLSLEAGMNVHLTKPVSWDDLAELLARPECDGKTLGQPWPARAQDGTA